MLILLLKLIYMLMLLMTILMLMIMLMLILILGPTLAKPMDAHPSEEKPHSRIYTLTMLQSTPWCE